MIAHPLDRIGIHVRGGHLNGGRQVDDQGALSAWFQDLHNLVADPDRKLQLGAGVGLGGVLVEDLGVGAQLLFVFLAEPRAGHRDVDDAVHVGVEDDPPLQRGGRVVEVHDGLFGSLDGFIRPLDEVLSRLGQHLDHDVVRDQVFLDQHPDEVEVRLARRWEADLNFLVAHRDQQLEHPALTIRGHRVDQRLVAVPKVNGAPPRGAVHGRGRPRATREVDRRKGRIAAVGHTAGLLGVGLNRHWSSSLGVRGVRGAATPQRGPDLGGLAAAAEEEKSCHHFGSLTQMIRQQKTRRACMPAGWPRSR